MSTNHNQHLSKDHWVSTSSGVHHISNNQQENIHTWIWQVVLYLLLILGIVLIAYYGHILLVSLLFNR